MRRSVRCDRFRYQAAKRNAASNEDTQKIFVMENPPLSRSKGRTLFRPLRFFRPTPFSRKIPSPQLEAAQELRPKIANAETQMVRQEKGTQV